MKAAAWTTALLKDWILEIRPSLCAAGPGQGDLVNMPSLRRFPRLEIEVGVCTFLGNRRGAKSRRERRMVRDRSSGARSTRRCTRRRCVRRLGPPPGYLIRLVFEAH